MSYLDHILRDPNKEYLESLVEKVFKTHAPTSLEEKQTLLNYVQKKTKHEKLVGCTSLAIATTAVTGIFYFFTFKNDFGIICLLPEAIIFSGAAWGAYLKVKQYGAYLAQQT